jgi:anti-sigma regulatory factor (Ser/Thr protein kinase)
VPAAELALAGDVQDVRTARRFVTEMLSEWQAEEYALAAAQIVSELATNAALHAHTPFTVRLRLEGALLHLEVQDGSRRPVSRRRYGADAATGRGLAVVEALSHSWGVAAASDGKRVWVRLAAEVAGSGGVGDWLELAEPSGFPRDGSSSGWSWPEPAEAAA